MKFPDESVLGHVSIEAAGEFEIVMRRVGSSLAGVDKTPSFYWHQAIEYVRARVAGEPTLAWPGEIDDILDDADVRLPADRPLACEQIYRHGPSSPGVRCALPAGHDEPHDWSQIVATMVATSQTPSVG